MRTAGPQLRAFVYNFSLFFGGVSFGGVRVQTRGLKACTRFVGVRNIGSVYSNRMEPLAPRLHFALGSLEKVTDVQCALLRRASARLVRLGNK